MRVEGYQKKPSLGDHWKTKTGQAPEPESNSRQLLRPEVSVGPLMGLQSPLPPHADDKNNYKEGNVLEKLP